MPVIVGSISAWVAGLGTVGLALLRAAVSVGISLALSFISRKLAERAEDQASTGYATELQLGAEVARQCVFGRRAVAGHLVYANTYGTDNVNLELGFVLSEGYCDSIESVFVNGEEKGLTSATIVGNEDARYTVDDFGGNLVVKFYSGKPTQAADSEFVANGGGKWTTDDKLTGMCWVAILATYDEDYFDRIPEFLFKLKGLRLYDWRLDSTNGGSGSHRWSDVTTWEWSANPAVIRYNFQRGIFVGSGEKVCGQGLAVNELLHDYYTTAADICDETVSLDGGGSEPRYEAHLVIAEGVPYRTAFEAIDRAMAGIPIERVGAFAVLAGAAYATQATITDQHLVGGEAVEFAGKRSRADLVNAVFGSFTDPDAGWEANGFPPITSSTYEAEDGSERLPLDVNLQAVTSVTQAQRIAKILLEEIRRQRSATIVVGYEFNYLEAGDWIVWNSSIYGDKLALEGDEDGHLQLEGDESGVLLLEGTLVMRITQKITSGSGIKKQVQLSLEEIDNAVYSWGSSEEATVVTPPTTSAPAQRATVSTPKIVDENVTTGKVADNAITQLSSVLSTGSVSSDSVSTKVQELTITRRADSVLDINMYWEFVEWDANAEAPPFRCTVVVKRDSTTIFTAQISVPCTDATGTAANQHYGGGMTLPFVDDDAVSGSVTYSFYILVEGDFIGTPDPKDVEVRNRYLRLIERLK